MATKIISLRLYLLASDLEEHERCHPDIIAPKPRATVISQQLYSMALNNACLMVNNYDAERHTSAIYGLLVEQFQCYLLVCLSVLAVVVCDELPYPIREHYNNETRNLLRGICLAARRDLLHRSGQYERKDIFS
jgi:hypothetical protein